MCVLRGIICGLLIAVNGVLSVTALSFAEPNEFHLGRTWSAALLGLEPPLGGLLFSADGATLYVVGNSERDQSRLYRIPVVRAASGEVTALGPAQAVSVAFRGSERGLDAGLDFGPSGHLFFTYWPANLIAQRQGGINGPETRLSAVGLGFPESVAGLTFSPHAIDPGTGFGWLQVSIWSLVGNRNLYQIGMRPHADGHFQPTSTELFAVLPRQGTGAIQYIPAGRYQGDMMFVNWDFGEIGILDIDPATGLAVDRPSGRPTLGTTNPVVFPFASGLGQGPWGLEFDPVTHDFFVATWAGDPESTILQIQGAGFESPCETAVLLMSGPNGMVVEGTRVQLFAELVEGTVESWQWFHNDRALTGETSPALTLEAVTISDAGRYRVTARSCGETVSSTVISLDVTQPLAAPVLSLPPEIRLREDEGVTITGQLTDDDSPLTTVRLSLATSHPRLLPLTGVRLIRDAGQLALNLNPAPDAFGETELSIVAEDPEGQTHRVVVPVVVMPVNDPPAADPIADQRITADQQARSVVVTGISSGPDNEPQALQLKTLVSENNVIEAPIIHYVPGASEAMIELMRRGGVGGTVSISLELDDGNERNGLVVRSFQLMVEARVESALSLELTSPRDGTVLPVGPDGRRDVRFTVRADERIETVAFYVGERLLGIDDSSPFEWVWSEVGIGDFEVRVQGVDGTGGTAEDAVRFAVSGEAWQVAVLPLTEDTDPVGQAIDALFEMGVAGVVLHEWSAPQLSQFDAVVVWTGTVPPRLSLDSVAALAGLRSHRGGPMPLMFVGSEIAHLETAGGQPVPALWQELTSLEVTGGRIPPGAIEFVPDDGARTLLEGRYGQVTQIEFPVSLGAVLAWGDADVWGGSESGDMIVSAPSADRAHDADLRRVLSLGFPLFHLGSEATRESQRHLFMNGICWLLRCATCGNTDLALVPVTDEALVVVSGETFLQEWRVTNNGACDATGAVLWVDVPPGLELISLVSDQGTGWQWAETGRARLNLGLVGRGAIQAPLVGLIVRGTEAGSATITLQARSNNGQGALRSLPVHVEGGRLSISPGAGGGLMIHVGGTVGRYAIETTSSLRAAAEWQIWREVEVTDVEQSITLSLPVIGGASFFRLRAGRP